MITQHDLFYTAPNAEMELNETNLTTYVKSILRRRQLDVSHLVTPVSGFWALLANDLQNQPNSSGIVRKAREEYEMLLENCKSEVRGGDVAETLQSASNICQAQKRFEHQNNYLCMYNVLLQ